MRILITGGGGMLGLDVQRAAEEAGHEPIALTRAQLDITDRAAVMDAVAGAGVDAVVNCAAWTDVDGAESHARGRRGHQRHGRRQRRRGRGGRRRLGHPRVHRLCL